MMRHIWRAADAGVMLWEPAVEAATTAAPRETHLQEQPDYVTEAETQVILASSCDDYDNNNHEPDMVFPSIEDSLRLYIKSKHEEKFNSKTPSDASRYTSESTLPLSSPCPAKQKLPVRRSLNFSMVTVRNTINAARQYTEPSGFGSLAALRKLERDPSHLWDEDERELLTILYRWYDDTDVTTLPKIFNAVTDQNIRLSVIHRQFKDHLILYGGHAYPEFGRVLAVPFYDSKGQYDKIHAIIKKTASECGINLSRREVEMEYKSGSAKHAKSPKTRKHYKSLVRRAAQRERERACSLRAPAVVKVPVQNLLLGGAALATDPRREDEERWSDVEVEVEVEAEVVRIAPLTPTQLSPRSLPSTNSIAFRVWDANSRTMFDNKSGFVSQAFSIWRGEFPPPFSSDGQGQQALMLLANLHLSMSGGASAFVSVSTSLLQALVKASTMEDPRIAVIALDHTLLQQPNKTLLAADIMRTLKSKGQCWWAKYKGYAERMVWASVPAAAVISHFSLSELAEISNNDQACADVLCLDKIRPGAKTQYVSSQLRNKNNIISISTARAMAIISRIFGMHRKSANLAHIRGLASCLVDSFQLKQILSDNSYTSRHIAKAFAVSLKSRAHSNQDVEAAFQDGIKQGTATIALWAKRRNRV